MIANGHNRRNRKIFLKKEYVLLDEKERDKSYAIAVQRVF